MIIYKSLKRLFNLTVRIYFRNVGIMGQENIPTSGPVILVTNHNSAFMDPIVLGVTIRQPVYFLARGESFSSGLIRWFFRQLNMIPIFRLEVTPGKMHRNKKALKHCYNRLGQGKTLMIFPEAFSQAGRRLRPLKTGTARIALGAEDEYDFKLGLRILPVGINYSNPHRSGSDLVLDFGPAIQVARYMEAYREDPKEAVRSLTADISERMARSLVDIKDNSLAGLVGKLEHICLDQTDPQAGNSKRALQNYEQSRAIVKALTDQPEKIEELNIMVDHYLAQLRKLKITGQLADGPVSRKTGSVRYLYLLLGAPVALYGVLTNMLPWLVVKGLLAMIRPREDFVGSWKLVLGSFLFPLFYLLEIVVFIRYTIGYSTLLFALTLYPSGLFAYHYGKHLKKLKTDLYFNRVLKERPGDIRQLVTDLEEIRRILFTSGR